MAFLDDKRMYADNWRVNKPKLINKQLEHTSNKGNTFLTTTGGKRKPTKCSQDTLHQQFNKDGTVTTNKIFDDIEIRIQRINKNESSLILGISANDKVTCLGIISLRDGNQQHQLIIALNIAKEGTKILICNPFTNYQTLYISTLTLCPN